MPALLYEVRDHIAYLTINRPEVHNSMNPEVIVRLAEAWQRVADDDHRADRGRARRPARLHRKAQAQLQAALAAAKEFSP